MNGRRRPVTHPHPRRALEGVARWKIILAGVALNLLALAGLLALILIPKK